MVHQQQQQQQQQEQLQRQGQRQQLEKPQPPSQYNSLRFFLNNLSLLQHQQRQLAAATAKTTTHNT